jgi:hypothetical protein
MDRRRFLQAAATTSAGLAIAANAGRAGAGTLPARVRPDPDLLAGKPLDNGDPDPIMVRDAAPPPASSFNPSDVGARLPRTLLAPLSRAHARQLDGPRRPEQELLRFRLPAGHKLTAVSVDGKQQPIAGSEKDTVVLTGHRARADVTAVYS